ncbi:MAG: DUF4388 domain-containing protein [Acidobacteriota bacterium]|nr:DUF4388 domain-containing protein [Acidobacteriota bacterium]
MSISGNLKTMELAELLQWVAQSGKTGTLVIGDDRIQKQIYFQGGQIIATGSSNPTEQLGHFLVSHGYINEDQLVQAIQHQESSGMMLGKILVTNRFITEEELHDLLTRKAQESIFDMFGWTAGDFRFVEEETLDRGMIPMALHVPAVVLQGMERVDDVRRIREAITSMDCVAVSVGPLSDSQLTPGEQKVLEHVNDYRTLEEICVETHSSDFFVSKVIFQALQRGVLKVVRPRVHEIDSDAADVRGVEAETLIDIADASIGRGEFSRALRHLRAARSLDPNGEQTERSIADAEEEMRTAMRDEGVSLKAVPRVSITPEDVAGLRLSPEEGFVLSRIDGTYDIESILKISPMPRLEAQLVFRKLLKAGHIHLSQDAR